MKLFSTRFLTIAASLIVLPLSAQIDNNNNQDNPFEQKEAQDSANPDRRFWEAKMPKGTYLVALDRINSIAQHEYIISNAASRVVELTITTSSGSITRFYYVEPLTSSTQRVGGAVQRGQELVDQAERRTGQSINNVVTKEYPTTTHTGQVEYRVSSESAIQQLHKSAARAWKDGRGRVVTVQ